MAPVVTISIPTTSLSSTSKPYTIYGLSIKQPLRNVTVQKRYSDFTTLHEQLTSQASKAPPAPLPQKNWFRSTVSDPALTESRRRGLETYLSAINEAQDPRWRDTSAWRTFLNLSSSSSSTSSAASRSSTSAGPLSDLHAPVVDPTAWLDVHRDLKAQIRDAKLALARRDQAKTVQEEHEASAEAKRNLARAGLMISALESGLQSTNGPSASSSLGPGELRRRRDLVVLAQKDRENLEQQLSARTNRDSRRASESVQLPAGAKDSLLGSTPDGAGQVRVGASRRVLGGQAKETERTRELDNAGVLQLQQQIMAEQDEDVTDLTTVVQRMRSMGVQINDELELQNEMLNMLDQDVDRVGNKVNVAKKRIGKIK